MRDRKHEGVSDFEKKILLILEQRICSISHVSREMNESREFARGVLESLRHRNILTKTTVGKSTVYLIKDMQDNFKTLTENNLKDRFKKL